MRNSFKPDLKPTISMHDFLGFELAYNKAVSRFNKTREPVHHDSVIATKKDFHGCFVSNSAIMNYLGY